MNNFGSMVRCKWLHLFQLGCFGRTLILMLGVPCCTYFLGVCHFTSSNQHNKVTIFLDAGKRCAHPQPFTPCRNPNNLTQNRINKLHQHWLMYLRHSHCNVSNFVEAFFLAHSIALASVSFYHTYGLLKMWAFIAIWSCCLGLSFALGALVNLGP